MSSVFFRTIRSLEGDRARVPALLLCLAVVLLAAWAIWFGFAQVTLYEASQSARLEVDRAAHPVQAPLAGRIAATRLELGMIVERGEVITELDAERERLELAEAQARLDALPSEMAALEREIEADGAALGESGKALSAKLEEARAQLREAEVAERLAADEARRLAQLQASGHLSDMEANRAQAEAQRRSATADSLRRSVDRLVQEGRTSASDRRARMERLQSEAARLEGEMAAARAAIDRLKHEIERRRIRAPIAGRLGEVSDLGVGAVVEEGTRLANIVPAGQLRIVAKFSPRVALGRLQQGQNARLRLAAFPSTQYGSVGATVSSVANEVRDGQVRVELAIQPEASQRIPLQHGLPGTVEVEVERVTPATVVLRLAGRLLGRTVTPSQSPPGGEGP